MRECGNEPETEIARCTGHTYVSANLDPLINVLRGASRMKSYRLAPASVKVMPPSWRPSAPKRALPQQYPYCTQPDTVTTDAAAVLIHEERNFNVPMYAFSGGGQEFRETGRAWDALAQLWPSSLFSVSPIPVGLGSALSSLTELAVLLMIPK